MEIATEQSYSLALKKGGSSQSWKKRVCASVAAIALLLGGCSTSFAVDHQHDDAGETVREIAPNVYSFRPQGSHYYSMFAVTDDGVVVFETVNSKHAKAMVSAIRDITDQPIKYALHSHNHWDHASGGAVMQAEGAKTVMHDLAAQWLEANPGPDTATPDIVWKGSQHTLEVGDISVEHHYLGLNHGLGMTVYTIPQKGVAYIADLVTPNRVMFSLVPDFNIKEWERTLGEILELDFEVAVCSHNHLKNNQSLSGCTKEHVSDEQNFIKDLRNAIFAEFKKGTPPAQIPSSVKLPQYAHWDMYEQWLPLNAQRVLLDIWMGPYPWVPNAD